MDTTLTVVLGWTGICLVAAIGYSLTRLARRQQAATVIDDAKGVFLGLLIAPWVFILAAVEGAAGGVWRQWEKARGAVEARCPTCGQWYVEDER